MQEQIHLLADKNRDFGFETTPSGKTYFRLLQDLKDRGHRIHLFFLWLPSVDIALERIADRVRRGGHNFSADVVRRRFKRGLPNLFQIYRPLLNFWAIIDNSTDTPKLIAHEKGKELKIVKRDIFSVITKSVETP